MKNQRYSLKRFLTDSIVRHQTWSFITILASILICTMVIWLNFRQNQLLHQVTGALENLHLARIELAKGFLYVTLSAKPDVPYSREEGLVLLNQAAASLEAVSTDLDIVLSAADVAAFQRDVDNFQIQLAEYQTAETSTPALETELRIAFHNLESQANEVDDQAHQQLDALRVRLNVQFALVLSVAVILLVVISVASIQSERTKARLDAALEESKSRYRLIAENSADVIWVMDPVAGKFTYVSPSVEKLRGYTPEEVMAQPVSESLTPESLKVVNEGLTQNLPAFMARGSGTESYVTEVEQPCKDGSIVKTEVITTYLFNDQGRVEIVGVSRDVTERKQAEENMRITLAKYQALFDAFPLGITVADPDGNILETNHMAQELLGISGEEQKQREIDGTEWRIIRPDGTQMPAEEFPSVRALKEERKVENVEMGILKPDGETTWINVTAAPLKVEGYGVVVTYGDITARKHVEQVLQETEYKYRTLVEQSPVVVYIAGGGPEGGEGLWHYISPQVERMLGYSQEEYQMHPEIWYNSIHPDDSERIRKEAEESMSQGLPIRLEYRMFSRDGHVVWVYDEAHVVTDPLNGKSVLHGIFYDITERKQAEEKLRELEVQLQKLNDNISNGYTYQIDFGVQGELRKFLYISAGVEKLMNISAAQVIESWDAFTEFFLPDDNQQVAELEQEALAAMAPFTSEVRFKHREGRIGWLLLHSTPYKMANNHIVWDGIALDITERKHMEEELRRSNAELEQFAYIASHDLQEPLRTVTGMVGLLQQRYKSQLDERADEYIRFAVDASERMQQLINDLLDFSRVGRKGKPFETASMEKVLHTALANLQTAIAESEAHITHDPLPTVHADPGQLIQVLQNLISNAIKFRGEEPPEVHVSAEKVGNSWQFAVRDNGIGIDPQYFERVFLIFQRLHTRKKYSGTGIGLALCKKIIERHGGKMWIESELKHGATFYFTIPERESL